MSDELIQIPVMLVSRWVKDARIRMRVFNGQIFEDILNKYSIDNKKWYDEYLAYNFNHLTTLGYFDDDITNEEFQIWINEYDENMVLLVEKERTDRKAFPEDE